MRLASPRCSATRTAPSLIDSFAAVALIEALSTAIADALYEQFAPAHVKVRVRKPEVRPAGIDLDFAAVTAERP